MSNKAPTIKTACEWSGSECAIELLLSFTDYVSCDACVFDTGYMTKEKYEEFIDDICNKLKQG